MCTLVKVIESTKLKLVIMDWWMPCHCGVAVVLMSGCNICVQHWCLVLVCGLGAESGAGAGMVMHLYIAMPCS